VRPPGQADPPHAAAAGEGSAGAPEQPTLLETLRRFEAAHDRRDFAEMRACFHDEARMESVASDGRLLGPDETTEAIRDAFDDGVYAIGGWSYEEIGPAVVLSWTGARRRVGESGMRDEVVYGLITGRDGLLWRARLFPSRGDALAHLERHAGDLDV
jgi:hypothetical protein